MIHSISANQRSFHTVTFTSGLNVILAERSDKSTEKDTRNGLGKSTLIEVIDFCLGSNANKDKGLIIDPLMEWAFTIDITVGGTRVQVTRSVEDHGRVFIIGDTSGWPEAPETDEETGDLFYKVERWRFILGWALFDLMPTKKEFKYKPSFRSLVPYFVRKRKDAYSSPFKHFSNQNTVNQQINVSYLLGMNWEYAGRWQNLKDQIKAADALNEAIKTGAVEGVVGSVGELETERIQLEQQTSAAKQALTSFRVHPQYETVQEEADSLTKAIHDLVNQNVSDRRRLTRYRESIKEEQPPASQSLEHLYEQSGLIFPDAVKKTLTEARTFHNEIVSNRRDFLETEIKRIKKLIKETDDKISSLTDQRASVMQVLKTHGALQEMVKLQEKYVGLQGDLERVQNRIEEVKGLKKTKREVTKAKKELQEIAEKDHEERRDTWSKAVCLFNENSEALYKSPGKLIIDIKPTGYTFKVAIERSGSEGIGNMKIFCFDLAMLELQLLSGRGVDFLIHDTLMYDAVDARQRALALELAHDVTETFGGQYICTTNSDMVPYEDFSDDFDFKQHVRLTLKDAHPSESLLGIRFERPEE